MAVSYKYRIAEKVRDILRALPDAPTAASVTIREDDSVQSRELLPQWVVTIGDEEPFEDTTAGDATGGGDVLKRNFIGVSMYYEYAGDLEDRISSTPGIVLAAQQALNVKLPVPGVWRSDLVRFPAWERNKFREGAEVTRFLMIYSTSEPRNG